MTELTSSNMFLDGLSLAPTDSACDDDDGTDDDMSFHDDTTDKVLHKVSGAVYCDNAETGIKEATLHLVDTGRAGIDTTTVKTDTNGSFTFSNVPSGTYTVCLEDTDALPDTSSLSRPLPKSKVVNVRDGIDVEKIIFRFGLSNHDSLSSSTDIDSYESNTARDNDLVSETESGRRSSSTPCLRREKIQAETAGVELKREDITPVPRKGFDTNNLVTASTVSLDGITWDDNDGTDDDMSFHDDTTDKVLQTVSGAIYCDNAETGIKEATLHLVDTGRAGIDTMTVKTDTNGKFTFLNVRSGTYTVCLEKTDALPDTSSLSRPLPKSKVVNVRDGINVENIIIRYGPSVAHKKHSYHVSFSLSSTADGDINNTTGDNELVAASEGGRRPSITSCLRREKIQAETAEAELNREDRTPAASTCDSVGPMKGLGMANLGTQTLSMHGLSLGPETWECEDTKRVFNDDDDDAMSFHDASTDITQQNDSGPAPVYGASAMSMRGLSFGTDTFGSNADGDGNDDDVSFHDDAADISLQNFFTPNAIHNEVLAGERPSVSDRVTSPIFMHGLSFGPDTLAWDNADHLFHDAASDITQPEYILSPISNDVQYRNRSDIASVAISTMSTDGLLNGDDNDDDKSSHDVLTGIVPHKYSRQTLILDKVFVGKRSGIADRVKSPVETLAWDGADRLFHDATSDITLPEGCIVAPIYTDVQGKQIPEMASPAISTKSRISTWEDANTDGLLNGNDSNADKSLHDKPTEIALQKDSRTTPIRDEVLAGKRLSIADRAILPMSMHGLSFGPDTLTCDDLLNDDDFGNDMIFHDQTVLQNVYGAVYCDNAGTGIEGATLQLVDTGRAGIDTMTVKTNTNGRFTFSNVPSGNYSIGLEDTDALSDISSLSRPLPRSKIVNVRDGIDVEKIIFRYGPSVASKQNLNHVQFSLSNVMDGDGNNTARDNNLVATGVQTEKKSEEISSQDSRSHNEDNDVGEGGGESDWSLLSLNALHVYSIIISVTAIVLLTSRKK